jgi:hypothetical protein
MKLVVVKATVKSGSMHGMKSFWINPEAVSLITIEPIVDGTGVCGPDGSPMPHDKVMLHMNTGMPLVIEGTLTEFLESCDVSDPRDV